MTTLHPPIDAATIAGLLVGTPVQISGRIYAGRDAVLPRLVRMLPAEIKAAGVHLEGGVIFHTAVSAAGIGPTSSNKLEIESSIEPLSAAGVRVHVGKGALAPTTVQALQAHGAVYAVTPPVSALLTDRIVSRRVALFAEEGMEALHVLEVTALPAIIAIAHGVSIFDRTRGGTG